MKLQRLLMIIFYLKIHNTATIAELSIYLEVSKRTVCRDIEMLRTAGVEVESSVGKTGGYTLSKDFSFGSVIFSKSELNSMLLGTKFLTQYKNTEFAKEADEVYGKLVKMIDKNDQSISKISSFLLIDTEHEQQPNEVSTILKNVENAYDNELLLFIEYKSPFCSKLSTAGFVAPYGLINKSGFWYIVGYCFEHKSYRTFNTLFIYNIYVTQKPFVKDSSFDLDAFWETQKKS